MIALALALQAASPSMVTIGAGAEQCRTWTVHRETGQGRDADKQWLSGFLTGLDFGVSIFDRSLVRDSDDPEALIGFVDDHCAAHPIDQVAEAAQQLYLQLSKRDQASRPR